MLKGKLVLNNKIKNDKNTQETLDRELKKNKKIDTKLLLEQKDIFFETYKSDEVLKIINVLKNNGVLLDIEIEGHENLSFNYENLNKKTLLIILSTNWEKKFTIERAILNMASLEVYEDVLGKCVRFFNNDEIVKTVIDLHEKYQYYGMRARLHLLSMYQRMFEDKEDKSKNEKNTISWKFYSEPKNLRKIFVDSNIKEDIVTKKDLLTLAEQMENAQEAIIPLLIFEGVKFSAEEDVDELRSLRTENLIGNQLVIRGGRERVIDLTEDVVEIVRDAIDEDYIVTEVFGNQREYLIQKSEYIVRRSITTGYDHMQEGITKYRGVYSRMTKCREIFESLVYDIPFTPKKIELFGKIHFINKYVSEGREVAEAIKLTLQRFGDWKFGESKKVGAYNHQLTHRLKTQWEIYK